MLSTCFHFYFLICAWRFSSSFKFVTRVTFVLILKLLRVRIRGVLMLSTVFQIANATFLVVVSRVKRVFVFQCVVYELCCVLLIVIWFSCGHTKYDKTTKHLVLVCKHLTTN